MPDGNLAFLMHVFSFTPVNGRRPLLVRLAGVVSRPKATAHSSAAAAAASTARQQLRPRHPRQHLWRQAGRGGLLLPDPVGQRIRHHHGNMRRVPPALPMHSAPPGTPADIKGASGHPVSMRLWCPIGIVGCADEGDLLHHVHSIRCMHALHPCPHCTFAHTTPCRSVGARFRSC